MSATVEMLETTRPDALSTMLVGEQQILLGEVWASFCVHTALAADLYYVSLTPLDPSGVEKWFMLVPGVSKDG